MTEKQVRDRIDQLESEIRQVETLLFRQKTLKKAYEDHLELTRLGRIVGEVGQELSEKVKKEILGND